MAGFVAVLLQLHLMAPPTATIGGLDADTAQALTQIVRAREDSRGNLFVFQNGVPHVAVFDSLGNRVATLGRAGAGPGEFAAPGVASFDNDTVWIGDIGRGKFSVFAPDFTHVRDVVVARSAPGLTALGRVQPLEILPDQSVLAMVVDSGSTTYLVRPTGELVKLVSVPETTYRTRVPVGQRGVFVRRPFVEYPLLVHADGDFLVVERDHPGGLRIRNAVTGASVTVPAIARATVDDTDLEADAQRFADNLRDAGTGMTPAGLRAAYLEAVGVPESSYFLESHHPGANGSVWFEQDIPRQSGSTLYEVMPATGVVIRTVAIPEGAKVLALGTDHLWLLELGPYDVPIVNRYRFAE